jgi:hypothetical protein
VLSYPCVVVLIVLAAVVGLTFVVAVIAAVVLGRRRPTPPTAEPGRPAPPPQPEDRPMTDLESALATATDRSGRPMRDVIEAEAAHVDDLRVPDDTGPLLRRALDSVARPEPGDDQPPA